MSEQIRMKKAYLRQQLRAAVGRLDSAERENFSREICQSLIRFTSQLGESGQHLFLYWPYRQEVNLIPYIKWAWSKEHVVLLPRTDVKGLGMTLHAVSNEQQLAEGPWGLHEPAPEIAEWTSIEKLDLILFPGLGFDMNGRRLGYGKGFYDRWWDGYTAVCEGRGVAAKAIAAAVAFHCQVVEAVPSEEHDTQVDHLWTERGQLF